MWERRSPERVGEIFGQETKRRSHEKREAKGSLVESPNPPFVSPLAVSLCVPRTPPRASTNIKTFSCTKRFHFIGTDEYRLK